MSTGPHHTFDWREIVCGSDAAAKAEAQRQQVDEDPERVEWIYLRNKAGTWVARRTPRHPDLPPEPPVKATSRRRRLLEALLDGPWNFVT